VKLQLRPPSILLAFAQHPSPYPGPPDRRRLADRAREVDEVVQVGRRIALAVADIVLLLVGLPLAGFFLWTHPSLQTPQGFGAIGAALGLIGVVRGGMDRLAKRPPKDPEQ
jgi:hypothetical protein